MTTEIELIFDNISTRAVIISNRLYHHLCTHKILFFPPKPIVLANVSGRWGAPYNWLIVASYVTGELIVIRQPEYFTLSKSDWENF